MPIVSAIDQFEAAAAAWLAENVEPAIAKARDMVAETVAWQWTNAKATWSPKQPNDYWSGQYRQSVRIAAGAPAVDYAPDNPGPWPIHDSPYPALDVADALAAMGSIAPFATIYVSDSVPYAAKVEEHTHPMMLAAVSAEAAFEGYSWGRLSAANPIPF